MDHLALLAWLASQKVERERRALAALDAQRDERRQEIARAQAEIERELGAATGLEGARLLATWLAASGQRRQQAQRALERLERVRAAQLARLIEQRLELKRLELLQARRQERQRTEAGRREQRAADELALIRAARRGAGRAR